MAKEEDAIYRNKVVKEVPVSEAEGHQVLNSLWNWNFKNKSNSDRTLRSRRSRICVRGCEAKKGYYDATYSTVAGAATIRLIFAIAALLGLTVSQGDIDEAFQMSKMKSGTRRFVKPPPGSRCPPGHIWEMLCFLYGYNDAYITDVVSHPNCRHDEARLQTMRRRTLFVLQDHQGDVLARRCRG